jgi:hypothetical protein
MLNIHMKKVLSQTWLVLASGGHLYSLFVDTWHDMCDNVKDHTILILFMYEVYSSIMCSFRLCCLFNHSTEFVAVGEGAVNQSELHWPAH